MNIQNYGFTKTLIQKNGRYSGNEMKWQGNYDGNIANIDININDNGFGKHIIMSLDNNDLAKLLGVQPVNIPLEQRLMNDFLTRDKKAKRHSRISKRHSRKSKQHSRKSYHSRKSKKYRSSVKSRDYDPQLLEGALYN